MEHAFDFAAYRKYGLIRMSVQLCYSFFLDYILIASQNNATAEWLWVLLFIISAAIKASSVGEYFAELYMWRRSCILTNGEIVFRRRRLTWPERNAACYVDYHIRQISKLDEWIHQFFTVWGQIEAVYVYRDGRTTCRKRLRKKVSLPGCFADMAAVKAAAERLRRDAMEAENTSLL